MEKNEKHEKRLLKKKKKNKIRFSTTSLKLTDNEFFYHKTHISDFHAKQTFKADKNKMEALKFDFTDLIKRLKLYKAWASNNNRIIAHENK